MRLRAWLLATCLCACGGAAGRPVVVSNDVTIAIAPAAPDLPFDPRSARIAQATRQLAATLGHPLAVQVDGALLPGYVSSVEDALAESIEQITRDLGELKSREPAVFAREAPLFKRVTCRYVATAEQASARFDAASGVVSIDEARAWPFVERGLVAGALEDDHEAWLDATFASTAPESVPKERWEAYFGWASRSHPRRGAPGPSFDTDPRGAALVAVARFARLSGAGAGGGDLARRIDEHLAHEMYYLLLAYENDGALVRASAPGSLFRRAEAAWVSWLSWRLPLLDARAKLGVTERLFQVQCGGACIPFAERFPGFDAFAFGLDVADAWIKAGRPVRGAEGDAVFELMDQVVCPAMRRPDGMHERDRGCAGGWFRMALADDALTAKLGAALGARGDAALVESMLFDLRYGGAGMIAKLWRALGPYDVLWHAAARIATEELLDDARTDLVAEAERTWAAAPQRRGAALYLLARVDEGLDPHYGDERWGTFDRRFGAPVEQKVFAAMLDESPQAMKVARVVWPALGKGWSRADVVVARMDRFLDDPAVKRGEGGEPGKTVRAIARRMCADGGEGELARLHVYLAKRGGSSLETLVADTAAGRCAALRKD